MWDHEKYDSIQCDSLESIMKQINKQIHMNVWHVLP